MIIQITATLSASTVALCLSGYHLSVPTADAGAGHTLGSIPLRILATVENLPIQFVVLLAKPD
jgi:hypothetical protein